MQTYLVTLCNYSCSEKSSEFFNFFLFTKLWKNNAMTTKEKLQRSTAQVVKVNYTNLTFIDDEGK